VSLVRYGFLQSDSISLRVPQLIWVGPCALDQGEHFSMLLTANLPSCECTHSLDMFSVIDLCVNTTHEFCFGHLAMVMSSL
jgi:hypothetical protein